MGNVLDMCTSCCKDSTTYEDLTPDAETRRQQQVAAAEKRRQEQESRGIGNVNMVKRQQQQAEEREKREQEMGNVEPGLKWQVS
ncbi:hypothetical protein HCN44_008475 [Aphidius gifuensis]|uniref:Small VCP/p97-interacting protein n=1 Tax=Aphidius gifuensis TaxID=684658 RepID=A0A834XN72_APHGI|nr:uncharacterized protein LOC122858198 [Aphidius gifuensis]KAF7989801.1 hypothetical protein HCN44_008475 [Aphidius gifuensis]